MLIHSISFDDKYYTKQSADKWLREHSYKPISSRKSTNYFMYRIRPKEMFKSFVTKKIGHINMVFGIS